MTELFIKLVNMSLGASILIAAVLLLRVLLRRAPRWTVCLMWAIVAVRLILPFSLESAFSLIPEREPIPADIIYTKAEIDKTEAFVMPPYGAVDGGYPVMVVDRETVNTLPMVLSHIWLTGAVLMLVYATVSYIRLKLRMRTAVMAECGIMQSENVDSPFVLGMFRPVVYLPFGIDDSDMTHVIAHERAHIRRGDHLWKPLGFLFLSVYWFNPLIWIAYMLLCRDIEAACDEAVISGMDADGRREYSDSLLKCAVHRRTITACPIAFGEMGVKARIKGIMNYKRPAFWVIIAALVACVVVAVCFLTDPKEDANTVESAELTEASGSDLLYQYTASGNDMSPGFILDTDNGTFIFSNDPAISFVHTGTYQMKGNELILISDNSEMRLIFRKNDSGYVYDGKRSTGIPQSWFYDKVASYVPDGALFEAVTEFQIPSNRGTAVSYPLKVMTLDDVIALSKREYTITEDDIGGYIFVETGSGLYIRHFDIDERFYLLVGGIIGDDGFNYVRLYCRNDGEFIDIREDDVEQFIKEHTS